MLKSPLYQAIVKLREARELVYNALGDTDAGDMTIKNIEAAIEELEADLDMFG